MKKIIFYTDPIDNNKVIFASFVARNGTEHFSSEIHYKNNEIHIECLSTKLDKLANATIKEYKENLDRMVSFGIYKRTEMEDRIILEQDMNFDSGILTVKTKNNIV